MKRQLWLASLLLITASPARATCIDESLEDLLFERTLVSQLDPRFAEAGIKTSNRGLCGQTCILNLMRALERATGASLPLAGNALTSMKQLFADSAAKGIDLKNRGWFVDLKHALDDQFEQVPHLQAKVQLYSSNHGAGFDIDDVDQPGRASLIAVRWKDPASEKTVGHVLLVKRISREKKRIYVIDPNFPRQELSVDYVEVEISGKSSFVLNFNYPANAYGAGHGHQYTFEHVITVDIPSLAK